MRKILQFFLVRIFIGIMFVVGFNVGASYGLDVLLKQFGIVGSTERVIKLSLMAVLSIGSYWLFRKYIDRGLFGDIQIKGLWRSLALGVGLGTLALILSVAIAVIFGGVDIEQGLGMNAIIAALGMSLSAGIVEELLLRGIILRILDEHFGSLIALVISSCMFGFLHILNPNSSTWFAISLSLQAGLFLGAIYIYSRSIFVPIGAHFAWNFVQAGVFGINVSGIEFSPGLFHFELLGENWLTGGALGIEGSVQATIICAGIGLAFVSLAMSNKNWRPFKVSPILS